MSLMPFGRARTVGRETNTLILSTDEFYRTPRGRFATPRPNPRRCTRTIERIRQTKVLSSGSASFYDASDIRIPVLQGERDPTVLSLREYNRIDDVLHAVALSEIPPIRVPTVT